MANPTIGPTAAQRAWVEKLGDLGTAAPAAATLSDDTRTTTSFGFFDPTDIPAVIIKSLTAPHSNVVRINNTTSAILRMDPESAREVDDEDRIGLSHGKFDSFPPDPIGAQSGADFKASSNVDPIFGQTLTGVEGRVRYVLDEQGTTWTIHHNNPFKGKNTADAVVDGPNKARFTTPKPVAGGGNDAVFLFTLQPVGGGGGGPVPPGPTPAAETKSSCLVTIKNQTPHVLVLVDQGHERGDFMTFPTSPLQPGQSTTFASVETPGASEQGCKGFVAWEVGAPSAIAFWRVGWDNPEQARNTTAFLIEPPDSFRTLDQIGQGEDNVPVVFTLSGGGPPAPPGPGPVPPPPPEVEVEFVPPVEARQPTLRKGDKSVDGWVEYAQTLLNNHLNAGLVVDGDFGSGTQKAVFAFQKKESLQQDGVIGNQTWAALRKGQPEKVGTDGRKPHTFVERGVEARWDTEKQNAVYVKDLDEMMLFLTSVGDARIDDFSATIRVTPPGTKPKTVKVKIGAPTRQLPSGAGHAHVARLVDFKKRFPAVDPAAKVTDYQLEAFLDAELGGDLWTGGKVVEG